MAETNGEQAARKLSSQLSARALKQLGLRHISTEELTIRRKRIGDKFTFVSARGRTVRDQMTRARLKRLAVPPAYEEVLYATDPRAHIQAIGRDAAGRLQYRYHADWEKVREQRKARRLRRLVEALPRIRRAVNKHLGTAEPTREFALAAVIELVSCSAIRAGGESYVKSNRTRGAATMLKSNIVVNGATIALKFRAKGGKNIEKEFHSPRGASAINVLRALPGRRMFQYRAENGDIRIVTASDVNAFLREIAGVKISLKDFRTLVASSAALEALAHMAPAPSERGRRRQVNEAVTAVSEQLSNTPTIARKSYVHQTVVAAFESGKLEKFSETLKGRRSPTHREKLLAQVIASVAA
ncbi:MAG: topoisomerase [Hyphomicrobiales bacterium]|jgi:DNA topoisomerase-1|nr:topoisomerase [Hyphomicrobiales bacterium]